MATFGKRSVTALATCDRRLVALARAVILSSDFTVLEGYRGYEAQEAAFAAGLTKAHYGHSAHNTTPSRAFDLAPYPIDWSDTGRFIALAGLIQAEAHKQGTAILWGGLFWGGTPDHPTDAGHFELKEG
jgi:peptidoglycan L-alanyl-D-glutamate endopeptidase CwlK